VRRIVHVAEERFFLSPRSGTFHGRDVFAPVAAALATGTPLSDLGPTVADMQRIELPAIVCEGERLRGQVIYVDHFGNLTTNLTQADLPDGSLVVAVGDVRLCGVAATYSAVAPGEPVAVVNSWGLLEIAIREGSARATLGVRLGDPVVIERS
jgi:S-adenosylmethionine hydrolase